MDRGLTGWMTRRKSSRLIGGMVTGLSSGEIRGDRRRLVTGPTRWTRGRLTSRLIGWLFCGTSSRRIAGLR
jgi:hypothetical protein